MGSENNRGGDYPRGPTEDAGSGLRGSGTAGRAGLRTAAPPHRGKVVSPLAPPSPATITPTCCATAQNMRCRDSSLIWMPTAAGSRKREGKTTSAFWGGGWWEGREGERKNRFELERGGASAGTEGRDSTRAEEGWGRLSQMAGCELSS